MLIYLQPPQKCIRSGLFRRKLRKKLRYFRLLPNLARQRKLIDLANHLPSSSPCGLLTWHTELSKILNFMASRGEFFVSRFWSKETLRICACKSPIAQLCAKCSWNGDDFPPVLPSLRFSPSNSCLFWWILSANSCLLVSNSIFFWESRK